MKNTLVILFLFFAQISYCQKLVRPGKFTIDKTEYFVKKIDNVDILMVSLTNPPNIGINPEFINEYPQEYVLALTEVNFKIDFHQLKLQFSNYENLKNKGETIKIDYYIGVDDKLKLMYMYLNPKNEVYQSDLDILYKTLLNQSVFKISSRYGLHKGLKYVEMTNTLFFNSNPPMVRGKK